MQYLNHQILNYTVPAQQSINNQKLIEITYSSELRTVDYCFTITAGYEWLHSASEGAFQSINNSMRSRKAVVF